MPATDEVELAVDSTGDSRCELDPASAGRSMRFAAGKAIKVCFVVSVLADLRLTLGIWGLDPGIRASG
ncbi:hypothetical protein FXW78_29480 [Rhodococcus opacus]|nr:hypothetical protein [Rhodococcus opacus]